jgi:hypothetical protein
MAAVEPASNNGGNELQNTLARVYFSPRERISISIQKKKLTNWEPRSKNK